MKLFPILLIISIIMTPIVYSTLHTHYFPFELMRDFKREKIPKTMVNMILQKMGQKTVSEMRNLKIVENVKDGSKIYYIECFVLDTTTHEKWNNPEAIYLFIFSLNNGHCKYISHSERNVWDVGQIIPEDTDALLELNPAVPNAAREDIGKHRFKDCGKPYCNKRKCEYTGNNSVMCEDTVLKTKNLKKPLFDFIGNTDNISNEWQTDRRVNKSKYNCEFILPEYSNMRHPFETSPFSCKLRYDLDHNPNRAPVIEETRRALGPLKAQNYITYA